MVFSRACKYAIRAAVYLGGRDDLEPVQIKDVASALDIPQPFLAKVVQTLARRGILVTTKGPGGGVSLAKSASDTTLLDVVDAVDGLSVTRDCVLGFPECSQDEPCPLHMQWASTRGELVEMLESRSVKDAAALIAARS